MNENWKFSDIPYTSPDVEALQTRYDALTRRARAAACPEDLLDVVRQRDALQQEVALCQSIATIRAFHDVTDEFYQRELQETLPRLETLDTQSLSMAIAESPYAAAVDGTFGPQLRRLLTLDQRLHTGGKELQARISRLTAQYQQLTASARYQVQGATSAAVSCALRWPAPTGSAAGPPTRPSSRRRWKTPKPWSSCCGTWSTHEISWPVKTALTILPTTAISACSVWAMAGRSWTNSAARCRPTSSPCICVSRRSSASAWG